MNYSSEPYMTYTTLAEQEFRTAIEPAITRAGGRILAAVHLGSTANNPPPYRVWNILLPEHADISRRFWGWIGPNDVDLLVIYDGQVSIDGLKEHYNSVQQTQLDGGLKGEIPPEQLKPILEPKFYSRGFVESLTRQLSDGKQRIYQVYVLNNPEYTREQAANRTLLRFVEFQRQREMSCDDTQHLSALVTSSQPQMRFLTGQDYAEEIAHSMREAFWPAEVNAMKGEKEGKKRYREIALARAREEAGDLPFGRTILKFDAFLHDSIAVYWHLKRGSEVSDPYGNLCRFSLPMNDLFNDISAMHEEARRMDIDIATLTRQLGGVPKLHKKPDEAERITRASRIFYTPEDFASEIV